MKTSRPSRQKTIPLAAALALVEEAVERTKSEIGFPERAAEFIRDGLRALAKAGD